MTQIQKFQDYLLIRREGIVRLLLKRINSVTEEMQRKQRIRNKTAKMKAYKEQKTCKIGKTEGMKDIKTDYNPVYCHCRKPDDGKLMIGCRGCNEWFHGKCVGILTKEVSKEIGEYFCDNCLETTLNISQETLLETSSLSIVDTFVGKVIQPIYHMLLFL